MKKKFIFTIDILTSILLLIQAQSTLALILEHFKYLENYSWDDYIALHSTNGIVEMIICCGFKIPYLFLIFIVFCFNIVSIILKLRDLSKKELVKGAYRYFIIFNVAFIVLKFLGFYFRLGTIMSA